MKQSANRFENYSSFSKITLLALVVILIIMILFLLAEGAVRIRQYIRYGSIGAGIEKLYAFDKSLNLRVPVANFRSDRISIDSKGFRNPEFVTPKPDGTIRISFLGGSTTFNAEVSSNKITWPHIVIENLRERYPKQLFDYINAGVPGYTSATSLRNLRLRAAEFEPDLIVIYHATNDLTQISKKEAIKKGIKFSLGDRQMVWLSNYSVLVNLIKNNFIIWNVQNSASENANKLDVLDNILAKLFQQNLEALVSESQKVAKKVALVTFSVRIRSQQSDDEQKKSAITSLYYMPYIVPKDFIRYFSAFNDVIRKVAVQTGALLVGNEHSIPGTAEYFKDSVHFTDKGSRDMAQRVANALIKAGAVESLR